MVKWFMMHLARWVLNWRLARLQKVFGDSRWTPSMELIISVGEVIPVELLALYTPKLGQRIDVTVGFKNCQHLIEWLDEVTNLIVLSEYIDDKYLYPNVHQHTMTLDDFLTNSIGGDVDVLYFASHFGDRMFNLFYAVDNADPTYHDYYLRRLTVVLTQLYNVQEGLLRVAMNV